MSDVNQIVSLGVGSPADIPHFILFGLSPTGVVDVILPRGDQYLVPEPIRAYAVSEPVRRRTVPSPIRQYLVPNRRRTP